MTMIDRIAFRHGPRFSHKEARHAKAIKQRRNAGEIYALSLDIWRPLGYNVMENSSRKTQVGRTVH
jgi:hypothetical protein